MSELQAEFGGALQLLCLPCNQFRNQEPGSATQIHEFVAKLLASPETFSKFLFLEKADVNGAEACPLYRWLKEKADVSEITWNFGAYFLLDAKSGEFIGAFSGTPKTLKEPVQSFLGGKAVESNLGTAKPKKGKSKGASSTAKSNGASSKASKAGGAGAGTSKTKVKKAG